MFDRVRTHPGQGVGNLGAGCCVTRIDDKLAVGTGENGDVTTRSDERLHISAQGLHDNGGGLGAFSRG